MEQEFELLENAFKKANIADEMRACILSSHYHYEITMIKILISEFLQTIIAEFSGTMKLTLQQPALARVPLTFDLTTFIVLP